MAADARMVSAAVDPTWCPYLFVYGTLRRGALADLPSLVGDRARLLGRASVSGRLYDLGSYPGMLDPVTVGERVVGELYELADVEGTLERLDEYEGCEADGQGAFRRCLRSALLADGGQLRAWTYLYQGPVSERQRILTGDYFRRRA